MPGQTFTCLYQPEPGYHPSLDGGPWIYVDLRYLEDGELKALYEGKSKKYAFKFDDGTPGPVIPPLRVVHAMVCLSDATVRYGQCPNNYIPRPGVNGYSLDRKILLKLNAGLAEIRKNKMKVVLGFTYNWPVTDGNGKAICDQQNPCNDAPLTAILQHMRELAPVLISNRDVIAAMHAGFIGWWGEWHNSTFQNDNIPKHNIFLDALTTSFGDAFPLQVRRPYVLLDYKAYKNSSELARLGLHDDEFGSNPGDGGTFLPAPESYPGRVAYGRCQLWDAAVIAARKYSLSGESTDVYDPPPDCQGREPGDFQAYAKAFSLGALHIGFANKVWENWYLTGQYDQIIERMGPHLSIAVASLTQNAGPQRFKLILRNDGWAAITISRSLSLRVQAGAEVRIDKTLPLDLKDVPPGGTATVDIVFDEIASLPAGDYSLVLAARDRLLGDDPSYALLFENAGLGLTDQGLNAFATIHIRD